ncbi:MAG: hypothetical protein WCO56_13680 [Verrucomicrobiota bacterium]
MNTIMRFTPVCAFAIWLAVTALGAAIPANEYLVFSLKTCDTVAAELPEITRLAEIVAQRHLRGGTLGCLPNGQTLGPELQGRSGGMICFGAARATKTERTDAEKTNAVILAGWDRQPGERDLQLIRDARARGAFLIGFGPRKMAALAETAAQCDAWFDTGFGDEDLVVTLEDGRRVGHGNVLVNTLHAWTFTAELVAALTREGKMPTMYKSVFCPDGREWNAQYVGKKLFHDDLRIVPIARGALGQEYLSRIRTYLQRFQDGQVAAVNQTARLIAEELKQGQPTVVAMLGHMPTYYVGKAEDARWARPIDFYGGIPGREKAYLEKTPDGALVLRLGYSSQLQAETEIFARKRQREMLITAADTPRTDCQMPTKLVTRIEMGWEFGDACVTLPGYPIKILPPSGVMQVVAYECVNVEVLNRTGKAP